ncbi:hypothetical protein V6N13_037903 [Hibiscus sabdariffa]
MKLLWRRRNLVLFDAHFVEKEEIVSTSIDYVRLLKDTDQRLPLDLVHSASDHGVPTGWCKPRRGWVKLKVDGAVSMTNGTTIAGGVFHLDNR